MAHDAIPSLERTEPKFFRSSGTVIRVDRTVPCPYSESATRVLHPELETIGPAEYELGTVGQWLHDDQRRAGRINGERIYEHLKRNDMLKRCLGTHDFEEMQALGPKVFHDHFGHKLVFGWKSCVLNQHGNHIVPSIGISGTEIRLCWSWLNSVWYASQPALLFAP